MSRDDGYWLLDGPLVVLVVFYLFLIFFFLVLRARGHFRPVYLEQDKLETFSGSGGLTEHGSYYFVEVLCFLVLCILFLLTFFLMCKYILYFVLERQFEILNSFDLFVEFTGVELLAVLDFFRVYENIFLLLQLFLLGFFIFCILSLLLFLWGMDIILLEFDSIFCGGVGGIDWKILILCYFLLLGWW